jgi:hypothetical protein
MKASQAYSLIQNLIICIWAKLGARQACLVEQGPKLVGVVGIPMHYSMPTDNIPTRGFCRLNTRIISLKYNRKIFSKIIWEASIGFELVEGVCLFSVLALLLSWVGSSPRFLF